MNDTDTRHRYRALIADRRARGHDLYGDRHLTAPTGQLRRATSELADAHVYITLERDRIRRNGHVTAGRLAAFDRLLEHTRRVGEQLAAAARDICDPTVDFEDLRQERSAYGQRKFGDRYLARDNLHEVLEELADTEIFIGLQADRLRHRGIYDDDVQTVLVSAADAIAALAGDVIRLRAAIAEMDDAPVPAQPAATTRTRLQTNREEDRMWPDHLVPDAAHGGIQSLPLVSASAHPQPTPQEHDCGCVTVLNITDADALHGDQPFEMRLAAACGRRDCLLVIDPRHALDARSFTINRLLGYDVPVHALDSREQQLTVLLDAAIAELRRIVTAVGYDRGEVADGDTITLADATQTLLELRVPQP